MQRHFKIIVGDDKYMDIEKSVDGWSCPNELR